MSEVTLGITDRSVFVFIPDPASTDGSGKTGLVAANLTVSYARMETDNDATVTDVTSSLNNLAALTTAHTDWGLIEISNTLAPGLYRLDIADAVFAAGAWYAVVYVMITTSAAAASPIQFELIAFNPLDAVRFGLTSLPGFAADAAGGLPISDAGGLDLDSKLANTNEVTTARMGALTDWINGGRLDLILDIVAADTTTDIPALIAALNNLSAAQVNAEADTALSDYDPPTRSELTSDTNSILARVSPIVTKTGAVNDAGASATVFITDLTESTNDYWKDAYVRLTSGALINQVKKISAYNGTTKAITVLGGFTAAPANAVTFEVIND